MWPTWKQKAIWFDALDYRPTAVQLPVHQSAARHLLVGGGWRGGKSKATAMEAFACWPAWKLLYVVGYKYENTLAEFDYLDQAFHELGARTGSTIVTRRNRPPSGQQRCTLELLDGAKRVVTVSVHEGPQAMTGKGEAPDMILLVEFEGHGYDTYLAARGRVAEKRGRLILSGTFPDDTGWQAQLWERWLPGVETEDAAAFSLATWDNLEVFSGGWDDPEITALRATYPEAELMRKFGARPQKPPTLVFPEFEYALHVRDFVEYDDGLPVEVWVDPGYGESAYAVLAVQIVGRWVFVVDEVYERGLIGEQVIELCKRREWWPPTGGVIDVAGRQHHAAKSQVEVWVGEAGVYLRSQPVSLEAGRERLKSFLLKQPETDEPRVFISPKCKGLIAEFGRYMWRRLPEERVAGEQPVDRHCDALKAIGYGLVDRFGVVEYPSAGVYQPSTREQLWQAIFKERVSR